MENHFKRNLNSSGTEKGGILELKENGENYCALDSKHLFDVVREIYIHWGKNFHFKSVTHGGLPGH